MVAVAPALVSLPTVQLQAISATELQRQLIAFVIQLLILVGVTAVVYLVARAVLVGIAGRAMDARDVTPTLRKPGLRLVRVGALFLALAVGFALAGFGSLLTSVATLAAALTLAIGFASQDIIANLVSGVFLISDPEFQIGDWVEWDDHRGVIEDISFRVTRVRTFNNELVTVPNSVLANTALINPVAKDQLRLPVVFGIGYDDDIDHARDVILEEAANHEEILDDPEPSVRLVELGDSAIGLQSRVWIADPARSDFVKVRSEYSQAVKERCDAEGIDMPYPHQELLGSIDVDDGTDADAATAD